MGIKYRFGNIIVGAPQIILGEYLNTPFHRGRLQFITGYKTEQEKEKEIKKLNNIITDIDISSNTNISILCGINDDRHISQIKEFYRKANDTTNIEIDLCSGDHGDIGNKYKIYLPNKIRSIIGCNNKKLSISTKDKFIESCNVIELSKYINKDSVKLYIDEENKLNIDFEPINVNLKYACYLICLNTKEIEQKSKYQLDTHFVFEVEEKDYMVKIYIKNDNNEKISKSIKFTTKKKLTIDSIR